MSYIPKSAQRKLKNLQKQRKERALCEDEGCPQFPSEHVCIEPPKRLVSGQPGAGMWDVYFNGTRQHLCTFADVQTGRITRFKHGRGNVGIGRETENLVGIVEIVRKGEPSTYRAPEVPAVRTFADPTPGVAPAYIPGVATRLRGTAGASRILAVAAVAALAMGEPHGED